MNDKYDMTGRLFKNDRKRPDHKDPDYTGDLKMNGKEFWLSAWIKDGDRGKWMSISVKPKEDKASKPAEPPAGPEDDVPF